MPPIKTRVVRCKVSTASQFAAGKLMDEIIRAPIETVKGSATTFQVAVFTPANAINDLSEVASLNLKIRTAQAEGSTVLADKTVAAAELDLTMTPMTWQNGTKQHAQFFFSNSEMNLPVEGARQSYWLVLSALTRGGNHVSLGGGYVLFHADQSGASPPPPEYPGICITLEQALAQFQEKILGAGDIPGLGNTLDGIISALSAIYEDLSNKQPAIPSTAYETAEDAANAGLPVGAIFKLTNGTLGWIVGDADDLPMGAITFGPLGIYYGDIPIVYDPL